MHRNAENLEIYNETCRAVYDRADGRCEVMVDPDGNACTDSTELRRCGRHIIFEQVTRTNFLHTATRNGKSDAWVLDPDNVTLGCASHHYEEGKTGKHVVRVDYSDELIYLPEE